MLSQSDSRRGFLKKSALITAGTLFLPAFLKGMDTAKFQGRRLVVIQLSGGNDGLNTVVPFRNDLLYQARPKLAIPESKVLKLTDDAGLNPAMKGFARLFEDGDGCILNSVGYPNPNRSHFRSMDIWHTASKSDEYLRSGWLGRFLDSECTQDAPIPGIEIGSVLSLAMKGEKFKGIPLKDAGQFFQSARRVAAENTHPPDHPMAEFLYKTLSDIRHSAEYLYEKEKVYSSKIAYPQKPFANELKKVAEMINSGVESPVYYVSLGSFDTHNNQAERHSNLLETYSEAVAAFARDLKSTGEWKNTLIMTFSEFGRRVKESASRGTDHGKANNLFLLGGSLKRAGFYNALPDLHDLDEGDLKHKVDFRQVYATILSNWLNADPKKILNGNFEKLDFV